MYLKVAQCVCVCVFFSGMRAGIQVAVAVNRLLAPSSTHRAGKKTLKVYPYHRLLLLPAVVPLVLAAPLPFPLGYFEASRDTPLP